MQVSNLQLTHFRNFIAFEHTFHGRAVGLIGDNGQGKTNILEALYCLASGESWRTNSMRDLIHFGYSETRVRGSFLDDGVSTLNLLISSVHETNTKVRYYVNDIARTKKVFTHQNACIVFAPEDLHAIGGAPSDRRAMLDRMLSRAHVNYNYHLQQYQQILPRRNKVLQSIRDGITDRMALEYWTDQMVLHGSEVIAIRMMFFEWITTDFLYSVIYLPNLSEVNAEMTLEQIQRIYYDHVNKNYHKEILSGASQYGPHKDDLIFLYYNKDISKYGSRGQQRSCLTWFLLQQYLYIQEKTKITPYILLDDVFSELDEQNQWMIFNFFNKAQIFISGCDLRNHHSGFDEVYVVKDATLSLI